MLAKLIAAMITASVVVTVGAGNVAAAERIGILRFEVKGTPEGASATFEQRIADQLKAFGYQVIVSEKMASLLLSGAYVDGCYFGPCLRPIYEATGLRQVLVGRLLATGSNYSLVVSLLDTRSGTLTAQNVQSCMACTVAEAGFTVELAVTELIKIGSEVESDESTAPPPLKIEGYVTRAERRRRQSRRLGYAALGLAVVGGALGGWALASGEETLGTIGLGAGGGLAAGGIGLLMVSRDF